MKNIYIAAENIVGSGGLRHYLDSLRDFLPKKFPNDNFHFVQNPLAINIYGLNTNDNMSDEIIKEKRFLAYTARKGSFFNRLQKSTLVPYKIKKMLKNIQDKIVYGSYEKALVKYWQQKDDSTYVLLPHIALQHFLLGYYAELTKKNLTIVIHDLHTFFYPEQWPKDILDLAKIIYPTLARDCKHIIVHNEFTKQSVIKFLGVSEDKITIVPIPPLLNVIFGNQDDKYKDYAQNLVLNKHFINNDFILWASSSTMVHKNHILLLNAWKEYKNINPNDKTLLVCTGSIGGRAWEIIQPQLGTVCKDVVFTDIISDYDLKVLNEKAMGIISPTVYEGGGSGPVLEAMFLGKPVACSNIPQIMQMLDDRTDLCFLFNPFSQLEIIKGIEYLISDQNNKKNAVIAQDWIKSSRQWSSFVDSYMKVIISE